MSGLLLEKTRRLNRILQNYGSDPVRFSDLCNILKDVVESNVYLASRKGRILGCSLIGGFHNDEIKNKILDEMRFSDEYNQRLLGVTETAANINDETMHPFTGESINGNWKRVAAIIPITSAGKRLGTLIFERFGHEFNESDIILAEYSATIAGMEITRSKAEELEEEARKIAVVQMAIGTLSYSELESVEHILKELDSSEGLLVTSKIADRVGITRSVIVNALRKLESAGIIESRSLGMKGTHIKVLNDKLISVVNKLKQN